MRLSYWLLVALFTPCAASAGPSGDELTKCFIESSTQENRAALGRWMFAAIAANPAVESIAKVSPKTMDDVNASAGAVFMRLLTETCKSQAREAILKEGPESLQISFAVLGQATMGELFANPEVRKAVAGLEKYVDKQKLNELQAPPK